MSKKRKALHHVQVTHDRQPKISTVEKSWPRILIMTLTAGCLSLIILVGVMLVELGREEYQDWKLEKPVSNMYQQESNSEFPFSAVDSTVTQLPDGSQMIKFPGGRGRQREFKPISEEAASLAYQEMLLPAISYLYQNYPIPSVREEFCKAVDNMSTSNGVSVHACSEPRLAWASTLPADEALTMPEIVFWMPDWIDLLSDEGVADWPSVDDAKRHFEDLLVMTICHEYYHCHSQNYWKIRPDLLTHDQLIDSESECLGYTCEKLIQPMLEEGRGPDKLDDTYILNQVYQQNHFGRSSEGWKQIIAVWISHNSGKQ